jgi:F-type H+-transporting ATPase subunit alpha
VQAFEKEFLQYMRDHKGAVRTEILEKKELTPELKTALTEAINMFKGSFAKK